MKNGLLILILLTAELTAWAGAATGSQIEIENDIPIAACEKKNLVRRGQDPGNWTVTPEVVGPSSLWNLGFTKAKSWEPTRVLVSKIFEQLDVSLTEDSVRTQKIISCLDQTRDWKNEFSTECQQFEKYLKEEIPLNLHMVRIHMSLAFPTGYKSGVEIWDPNLGIEQKLYVRDSWPISGQKQPLTDEEEEAARKAFFIFWDQLIERNLVRYEKLVRLQPINPFSFKETLQALKEAQSKPTAAERAQRAGNFPENFWQGILTKELRNFRNENLLLMIKEIDAYRVLALMTSASPSPLEMKKAFTQILEENSRLREKTKSFRQKLSSMDSIGSETLQFAFSLTETVENVLGQSPEYCGLAVTISHHIANRDFRKEWGSEAVLFGSSLFMSSWISIPLFAGSGAYWIIDSRREYYETLQKALATTSKNGSLVSMSEIVSAAQTYENAFLELPLAFMGFPGGTAMAKWKLLLKIEASRVAN